MEKTKAPGSDNSETFSQDEIVDTENEFQAFAAVASREYFEVEEQLPYVEQALTKIPWIVDLTLPQRPNIKLCLEWLELNHPDIYSKCLEVSFDRALAAYCSNTGIRKTDENLQPIFTEVLEESLSHHIERTKTWIGRAFWLMLNEGSIEVHEAAKNFYQ